MFTHTMVGSNDIAKSKAFYDATLGALGLSPGFNAGDRVFYKGAEGPAFGFVKPINGQAATGANGGTIGFQAKSYTDVDAWHAAGLANGGSCEGKPGVREQSPGHQYGAYLRDPDGNKICAFAPNPNAPA